MTNNKCIEHASGYGCYLYDTGILIEECEFKNNDSGGLHSLSPTLKNEKHISDDIKSFLDRFPLILHIVKCEFTLNNRSGIVIDDFWKGPVVL